MMTLVRELGSDGDSAARTPSAMTAKGKIARMAARVAVAGPWRRLVEKMVFVVGHRFPTNPSVLKWCRHFASALIASEGERFERVAVFESGGRMHCGADGLASPFAAIFYFVGTIAAQGGEDERFITKLLPRIVVRGDVFVDIGANVGFYSCFVAPLCGQSGSVHAFEANPYLIPHLRRSAELNRVDTEIVVNAVAVGNTTNATLTLFDPEWIGSSSVFRQAWLNNSSAVTVPVTTIDEYRRAKKLDRVDVVKLDIEGGELDALRGMQETFASCPPRFIICELAREVVSTDDPFVAAQSTSYPLQIVEFLEARGYEPHYISEHDGRLAGRVQHSALESMTQKAITVGFVRPSLRREKPELFAE
jgi:FkbM family methyltransferase